MILTRIDYFEDGIWGHLTDARTNRSWMTCEHAYRDDQGEFKPKVPQGTYVCIRGVHQLHGMEHPFETFEVTDVPGHSGILFHKGNYNQDSAGCILLGTHTVDFKGGRMLQESAMAFDYFTDALQGLNSFVITIW